MTDHIDSMHCLFDMQGLSASLMYQEFNLSHLHQQLQERDELSNMKEPSNTK
jgi:hypothetical protein